MWNALPDLDTLILTNTNCSGYIPTSLLTNTNISTINLNNNTFTGEVPYRNKTTGQNLILPSQAPAAGTSSACLALFSSQASHAPAHGRIHKHR